MTDLALFVRPTCPFCRKVTRFMAANGINVPQLDILTDRDAYAELVDKGGMDQVPCLRIGGDRYLYESDDIIAWLKENAS